MSALSTEEKLELAIEALRAIAKFDHAPNCPSSAPVHECGCYESSEREMAKDTLVLIGQEEEQPFDYNARFTIRSKP